MGKKMKDSQKIEENNNQSKFSFSNISIFIMIILLTGLNLYLYLGINGFGFYGYIGIALSIVVLGVSIFSIITKSTGWLKTSFVTIAIQAVISWAWYLFVVFDLIKYFNNQEELQKLIQESGIWSYLVFTLLQFLQVTFIPLPAIVTTMAGTFLFGPGVASILSLIGIMSGSIIAFVIGDKCGEKVVAWIIGEEQMKKYSSMLYDRGKYLFFLMMLFPLFPDDILCLVAGMTTMSYRFFLTTIILTRPIGIIMTCYLGSGQIIPYTELWGLIVWGIIIIIMATVFWLSYKYKDQIEKLLTKLGNKIKVSLENFVACFSKSYKAKLILKRNQCPYLLLEEKTGNNIHNKNDIKNDNKKEPNF